MADEALIDELAGFERAGDLASGLQAVASRAWSPEALLETTVLLYRRGLTAFPFVLADQLLRAGAETWIVRALSAYLALKLDRSEAADANIERLSELLSPASAAERAKARALLDPFLPREAVAAFRAGRLPLLRRLARLWSAVEPGTMRCLAPPAADRAPDYAHLLDPPDGGRLVSLAAPAADAPRRTRNVVLAMRPRWMPHPGAREHELPARFVAAMENYGWRVRRNDIRSFEHGDTVAADYRGIADLCRETSAELVLLDEFQPRRGGNTAPGEIVSALRRDRPELRVVGIYCDPWQPTQWDDIAAAADLLDGFWSCIVTPLWSRPALRAKALLCPFPHGGTYRLEGPLRPELGFVGGVQYSNWYRAFWLTAIADAELPFRASVSAHADDHLPVLESYRQYMRKLGAMGASVNFAMRSNGRRTLTGRTYEVLAAGGLLVQERADDVDLFLVPGRHYLRFDTLTDLFDVVHLLRAAPDRAEDIRRAGADFFCERYADDRIISYLDHVAFHRPVAAPSPA
jgi:hypothetical protein